MKKMHFPWKKRSKIESLDVDRVDLVTAGANPDAHIKLFKKKGVAEMKWEDVEKQFEPEEKQLFDEHVAAEVAKAVEVKQGEIDDLTSKLSKAEEEKGAAEETAADLTKQLGESSKEDVVKLDGLDPEVRKMIEDANAKAKAAEETLTKMAEEKEDAEFLAKAAKLDNLPVKAEELAPMLKVLAKADADVFAKAEALLTAANTALEQSDLFKSVGTDGEGEDKSAGDRLEEEAQKIMKADGITYEQAISKAYREFPELYKEVQSEKQEGE